MSTVRTSAKQEEAQIQEHFASWARALHAKDVDTLMAHYAPDIVTFDLRPPTRVGADAYRKNFEAWFAATRGPIEYEMRELQIATSDHVAFCHCLSHIKSTRANGDSADYWVRVTVGLQKKNGSWTITHEHVSMPFDMETMKAVPSLQL
jgi:uncharacterized protein (TIGR02246 family)